MRYLDEMDSDQDQSARERNESHFVTTRWTTVAAAAGENSSIATQALERLCADYWRPIFRYFVRSVGSSDQARDLTQAFFVELLESRSYARAIPERGRFRSYLLSAAKYFLADQHKRANAQKRGGHVEFLQFDTVIADANASSTLPPDQQYDKDWAFAILDRSVARLREEFQLSGRAVFFDRLKGFLTGDKAGSFADAARELRITEGAAKMTVTRMRHRLRTIARQELAETVATRDQFETELESFRQILSS